MDIRKEKINNNEFIFVNTYKSTRSGFQHKTTLMVNNCLEIEATCNYINRTWENYAYQSVMLQAIRILENNIYNKLLENYKLKNNIKRLTAKKKEEFEKQINNELYNDILELKKVIRGNVW